MQLQFALVSLLILRLADRLSGLTDLSGSATAIWNCFVCGKQDSHYDVSLKYRSLGASLLDSRKTISDYTHVETGNKHHRHSRNCLECGSASSLLILNMC